MDRVKQLDKEKLRQELKALLRAMRSQGGWEDLQRALAKNVQYFLRRFRPGQCLGLFSPFKSEPDLVGGGANLSPFLVALPQWEGRPMEFFWDSRPILPAGIVLPGLGFTRDGLRLGRGGGHYDRYLRHYSGPTLGVCFSAQVCRSLPQEEHDQRVGALATERELIDIKKGGPWGP